MNKTFFGFLKSGEEIYKYTLENECARLTVMNRGATVIGFEVFGKDIIGGFDTLDGYLCDNSHQGGTIGRVANRVAGASFSMDGAIYMLPDNDHGNCLHGGDGFDHRVWDVLSYSDDSITFTYTSADGEEGFPASLSVRVKYTLIGTALRIDYSATPDGKTPVSLTNHSYFNLNGFGGNIEGHTAQIFADTYTEVGDDLIPNGNRPSVAGTVFDLREPILIGKHLTDSFIGYDHNFNLNPSKYKDFSGKALGLAAVVSGNELKMSVYTDQPGIQFYIGNFLGKGPDFKGGIKQVFHGAFCLETQTEPNSINHGIGFYEAGETYTHTTVYCVEKI